MKLLHDLRAEALHQPGYMTGETLIEEDDPLDILVMSTWVSVEHWKAWLTSQKRIELAALIDGLLDNGTKITAYKVPEEVTP